MKQVALKLIGGRDNWCYRKWLRDNVELNTRKFEYQPLISVVVPTYNTPVQYFHEMVSSVIRQTYQNWELILVDDASLDENIKGLIMRYAESDERIRSKFLQTNCHIAGATNVGIKMASGEFVSLLDHDDLLWPNALHEVVNALNEKGDLDFIYTDEDKISKGTDSNHQPFLKPDWNQDFMYSVNFITHFATIRKSLLDKAGYEDGRFNGAQDWELFLRIARNTSTDKIHHIPKVLYSWRAHPFSTAKAMENKPYAVEAQRGAIESELLARGFNSFILEQDKRYPSQWRVGFYVSGEPRVTIFVSKSLRVNAAKKEIEQKTDYRNFEIKAYNPEADLSQLLNRVTAGFVVFVNVPVSVRTREWLQDLMADAQRPDIGFVLARTRVREIMNNLTGILAPTSAELIRKLTRRNVGKHLYLTSRYNVGSICGGVVMIELKKIKHHCASDILQMSEAVCSEGYKNLYNPYVRVLKHSGKSDLIDRLRRPRRQERGWQERRRLPPPQPQ